MGTHMLYALAWSALGCYGVCVYIRHRRYVEKLPLDSPGNRSLRLTHRFFLAGAIASLLIAVWNLVRLW